MFHDLNVQVSPTTKEKAILTLSHLGYDVIAFNTVLAGHKKFPDGVRRPDGAVCETSAEKVSLVHPNPTKRAKRLTVLERITLVIDDPSCVSAHLP